ncbi:hypothetical protein QBC39DRAFT_23890 [Podospora conica]|nr:hypothetical protein QBC39DRAFT_23890 [Schizothecium conicum]
MFVDVLTTCTPVRQPRMHSTLQSAHGASDPTAEAIDYGLPLACVHGRFQTAARWFPAGVLKNKLPKFNDAQSAVALTVLPSVFSPVTHKSEAVNPSPVLLAKATDRNLPPSICSVVFGGPYMGQQGLGSQGHGLINDVHSPLTYSRGGTTCPWLKLEPAHWSRSGGIQTTSKTRYIWNHECTYVVWSWFPVHPGLTSPVPSKLDGQNEPKGAKRA